MSNQYVVADYNDQSVTLKPPLAFGGLSTVTIPRAQIASVKQTLGVVHVETTGGRRYKVYPGMSDGRDRIEGAFGIKLAGSGADERIARMKASAAERAPEIAARKAQAKAERAAKSAEVKAGRVAAAAEAKAARDGKRQAQRERMAARREARREKTAERNERQRAAIRKWFGRGDDTASR